MKKSKQCTYSPELAVESLQTSFWDTDPSLQSSGMTTQPTSSESDQQTDGLTDSRSGMETLENLTHMTTKDEWIAFMRDSHARIFQSQEVKQALQKAQGLDFTAKSYALLTRYDLDTCSWKTLQTSLVEMTDECSEQSLETLPSAAMMRSGLVYQLPKLAQTISETGGGSWPTPDANCGARGSQPNWTPKRKSGQPAQYTINQAVRDKPWPTPSASDNRDRGNMSNPSVQRRKALGKQIMLSQEAGGALNPPWVEWLMGWPVGHTDLKR